MEGGMNRELWLSHAEEMRAQLDLQEGIWAELRREPGVDVVEVNVYVDDFIATLRGTVPSDRAKIAVERAAERVPHIRAVISELTVTTFGPTAC
ncbi:MAG TPA: BON domain-containing protein [Gemmatimonadales bacterium]|jgi:osmotically-inducible protein OsmY|nr:BON domain-containing protein [Gemmatimonadales bacterium]